MIKCSKVFSRIHLLSFKKNLNNSLVDNLMIHNFLIQYKMVIGLKYKRFKKIPWIWSHHLHHQLKFKFMGGKVCLKCKSKTLLVIVNKLFCFQKFVDITQQCFALLPQENFPANNLNFHWRESDEIKSRLKSS